MGLTDEPVKLFRNLPSVIVCSASEPFHGLFHAIRPEEESTSATTGRSEGRLTCPSFEPAERALGPDWI